MRSILFLALFFACCATAHADQECAFDQKMNNIYLYRCDDGSVRITQTPLHRTEGVQPATRPAQTPGRRVEQRTDSQPNPVCRQTRNQAESLVKKQLMDRYAPNYSTVEMLLRGNMKDYDKICALPNNKANIQILQNLMRYFPHYSTILMLYKSNVESYRKLNR